MVVVDDHDASVIAPAPARPRCPSPGAVCTTARPPWRSIRPTIDSRTPRRSAGTAVGVEARPAVAHEHLDPLGRDLGVERHRRRRAANLAAFTSASRAAATSASRARVERRVADRDDLDRHAVRLLDLGRGRLERELATVALAGRAAAVQPRAQLALLAARERGHLARVVDARFCISASVCSTESCRCAATSARSCERIRSARSARQAAHEPQPPRREDQRQRDHDHDDREQHVARRLQRVVEPQEDEPAADHQRGADDARPSASAAAQAQRPRRARRPRRRRRRLRGSAAAVDWRQISAPPAAASITGHTIASLNQRPQCRSSSSAASASSTDAGDDQPRVSRRPAIRSIGARRAVLARASAPSRAGTAPGPHPPANVVATNPTRTMIGSMPRRRASPPRDARHDRARRDRGAASGSGRAHRGHLGSVSRGRGAFQPRGEQDRPDRARSAAAAA